MRSKALEKGGKKLVLALLRPLLGGSPLGPEVLTDRRPKRILVVRQDERMGNVLLIIPFLESLRKILPRAEITALVSRRFSSVLVGNPAVDEIMPFDKKGLIRNPLRLIAFFRKLRSMAFDLAIDCGPVDGLSLNNALLTYLSGAPLRLGYLREQSHLFLNLLVPRPHGERSEIDHHLNLLRFSFGSVPGGRVKIYLTAEERQRVARQQRQWGLREGDLLVGLHVGGRGQKRWPLERFARLARRLIQDHGAKVILFWGPNEEGEVRQFERSAPRGLLVPPLMRVRELAAHVERCAVFISGDTGPMHLAQALGTPTICVFRVPNFRRYGGQGPRNRIVYRPGGDVPVEDVLTTFGDLLGNLPLGSAQT